MVWPVLVATVPLLLLAGLSLQGGRRVAQEDMARLAKSISTIARHQTQGYLAETKTEMERVAKLPAVRRNDEQAMQVVFGTLIATRPSIVNVGYVSRARHTFFSIYPTPEYPNWEALQGHAAVNEVLQSREFVISRAMKAPKFTFWMVAVGVPVPNDDDRDGIIIAALNLPKVSRALLQAYQTDVTSIYVVSEDDTVILASNEPDAMIGHKHPPEGRTWREVADSTGVVDDTSTFGGVPHYCVATRIPGTRFLVISAINRERALGATNAVIRHHLWLGLVFIVFITVVLLRFAATTSRRMRTAAASVAAGKATGKVEIPEGATTELAGLIHSVNELLVYLRNTEAERLADQARALKSERVQSLGLLAGGIAHDFNNLLTGIMGHLELLAMDFSDQPEALKCLAPAQKAAQLAKDLCKQILAFAGRGHPGRGLLDVNQLVRDTAGLLKTTTKHIEVHFDLSPAPCHALGDGVQIRQIVLNILVNAAEAIDDRTGNVYVSTRVVDLAGETASRAGVAPGQFIEIAIRDDGPGMTEEVRARIFTPFFTTKVEGTGIGLASATRIMAEHGGAIAVQSETGRGATFTLWLPARAPGSAPPPSGDADRQTI